MSKARSVLATLLLAMGFARVANAASWVALSTNGGNNRLYAGPYQAMFRYPAPIGFVKNDWAYGYEKVECGVSGWEWTTTLLGVSNWTGDWACGPLGLTGCFRIARQVLLCGTSSIWVDQYYGTRIGGVTGDSRRDTAWGDWARTYNKYECGPTEVVTGLSFGGMFAICSGTNLRGAAGCYPRWADGRDSQPAANRGDWDVGASKAECDYGEYVKGVAISDGMYKGILCCKPVF